MNWAEEQRRLYTSHAKALSEWVSCCWRSCMRYAIACIGHGRLTPPNERRKYHLLGLVSVLSVVNSSNKSVPACWAKQRETTENRESNLDDLVTWRSLALGVNSRCRCCSAVHLSHNSEDPRTTTGHVGLSRLSFMRALRTYSCSPHGCTCIRMSWVPCACGPRSASKQTHCVHPDEQLSRASMRIVGRHKLTSKSSRPIRTVVSSIEFATRSVKLGRSLTEQW